MLKTLRISFIPVLLFITSLTISQINTNWESIYNGPADGDDTPYSITTDEFGNVYTAGCSKGINTGIGDIAIIKYNSLGTLIWERRFNGIENNTDAPYAMLLNNNTIYIAGHSAGKPLILNYNTDGDLIFTLLLNGYGSFSQIQKRNNGEVFISGNHIDSLVIVKFNNNNQLIWYKNYLIPDFSNNVCKSLKLGNNGEILIAGMTNNQIGNVDGFLMKLDDNGINLWTKIYNSIYNLTDYFEDITVSNNGNIIVSGQTADSLSHTLAVILNYDQLGNIVWQKTRQSAIYRNIDTDNMDNIYVGGMVYNGSRSVPAIIKYNQSGNEIWLRSFGNEVYSEYIYDMKVKNCTNIYLAILGSKFGLPSYTEIIKFNSNGIQKWNRKNFGPVFDTSLGTGAIKLAFHGFNKLYSASAVISNPRKNDFHTTSYTESYFSISGYVTYKDNNQPVTQGYVKALYFDNSSSGIIVVDSAEIQSNGFYTLYNVPKDTLDLMFYQDDEELNFVPTYYISTIDWREATPVYATQNLTNINCQVFRINNNSNPFYISGQISANIDLPAVKPIKDAIIYVKSGNIFKNYGISDANGNYTSTYLPSGSYELITYRKGFVPVSQNVIINNNNLNNINFNLGNSIIGIQPVTNEIPESFSLSQNYPNPFNPVTTIKFGLPVSDFVKLEIFDVLGRNINTLVNEKLNAGIYTVEWNSQNKPSGIYFYRLSGSNFSETRKMILIK